MSKAVCFSLEGYRAVYKTVVLSGRFCGIYVVEGWLNSRRESQGWIFTLELRVIAKM